MAGDIYYPNVSLLLHCDGIDGSTTFTDSSPTPKTVTVAGNAHIETDQAKFGTASAAFDGAGDYLSVAHSAELNVGTGLFTFECFVRLSAYSSVGGGIFSKNSGAGVPQIWLRQENNTGTFRGLVTNGTTEQSVTASTAVSLNTWTHVAFVRTGPSLKLFIGGVGASVNYTAVSPDNTQPLLIGAGPGGAYMTGYLDDIRFTPGIARYTENFTPPTAPFLNYAGQLSGEVRDVNSVLLANAVVRAYRRDTGALLVSGITGDLGEYALDLPYAGEVQLVYLDADAEPLYNDKILRAVPA